MFLIWMVLFQKKQTAQVLKWKKNKVNKHQLPRKTTSCPPFLSFLGKTSKGLTIRRQSGAIFNIINCIRFNFSILRPLWPTDVAIMFLDITRNLLPSRGCFLLIFSHRLTSCNWRRSFIVLKIDYAWLKMRNNEKLKKQTLPTF